MFDRAVLPSPMPHEWTAEVTNDPSRDFDLCIELSFDGRYRATVFRADSGELVLRWYADPADADVPAVWLIDVLRRADADLPIR